MMRDRAPGRLIGSGRAADVYELGGGRVLRRYRIAVGAVDEARLAVHVAREGIAQQCTALDGHVTLE